MFSASLGGGGYPHFTDEEKEAQAGKVSCPRSQPASGRGKVQPKPDWLQNSGSLSSPSYRMESELGHQLAV